MQFTPVEPALLHLITSPEIPWTCVARRRDSPPGKATEAVLSRRAVC